MVNGFAHYSLPKESEECVKEAFKTQNTLFIDVQNREGGKQLYLMRFLLGKIKEILEAQDQGRSN